MITKHASAAQRSTVDTCRTLIIWLFFLSLGKEKFLVGELVGFFLLVLGTLVYNEIIEIPLMNYNTKSNIAKREEEEKNKLSILINNKRKPDIEKLKKLKSSSSSYDENVNTQQSTNIQKSDERSGSGSLEE